MPDGVWQKAYAKGGRGGSGKSGGLNQLREVKKAWFGELPQYYEMFQKRLGVVKSENPW